MNHGFQNLVALILLCVVFSVSSGAPEPPLSAASVDALFQELEGDLLSGWRMKDRFDGFRFEVHGPNVVDASVRFVEAAQALADELFCFGWAQPVARAGTIVGEARCNTNAGPRFREWLRGGPPGAVVTEVAFRAYESTKIKLHFSHFKILDASRPTCFPDAPHQCAGAAAAAGGVRDEL